MDLIESVLATIRRHRMVPAGGRVLVALSGGPDSVALLHVLTELERRSELVVAGIAHFNHQLRGEDADTDETFCRDLAASFGAPFESGRADVRGQAQAGRRSIEDAARLARYGFLHEAARRLDVAAIAVGHTRDDQAETFLLRLIRGAGTRGLGAIRPRAGLVIRPMIEESRAGVRAFVEARGLPFRDDVTNADVRIPRNRIRHELLPYLERTFSPGIVEVLAREAGLARIDEDRLELEAIELAASVVLTNTGGHGDRAAGDDRIVIDATRLKGIHPALAMRVVRGALERSAGGRFIGFDAVHRLLTLIDEGRPGVRLSLPGCEAVFDGRQVRLEPPARRGVHSDTNSFRIPLSIPGEVVLTPQALAVSASWAESAEASPGGPSPAGGYVRVEAGPLAVRSRKPGDRFQPPGLGGRSRKLQDYFVDRKVARNWRDQVPLVVDGDDRIVWVVGHGFSEAFRAPGPATGVIFLKARRLGGEV